MKHRYKVKLLHVQNALTIAADALSEIGQGAELYYAAQEMDWQEGQDGHTYCRQMGELREAAERLRTFALPEIETLAVRESAVKTIVGVKPLRACVICGNILIGDEKRVCAPCAAPDQDFFGQRFVGQNLFGAGRLAVAALSQESERWESEPCVHDPALCDTLADCIARRREFAPCCEVCRDACRHGGLESVSRALRSMEIVELKTR